MNVKTKTLGVTAALFIYGLLILITEVGRGDLQWPNDKPSPAMNVYSRRKGLLHKMCRMEYNFSTDREYGASGFIVDNRHRLLYCPIAKVASSFWGATFRTVLGKVITLKQYDDEMRRKIMANYTTFLFVREPYSRLLACYIDKFFTLNSLYWKIGKIIVRKNRINASAQSLACGQDVTFPEFIKHVIYTLERGKTVDSHWMPMHWKCSPCKIRYDIIGKLETMPQDSSYISHHYMQEELEAFKPEKTAELQRLQMNFNKLFVNFKLREECSTFPEALHRVLRKEQIRGVIHKYVKIPKGLTDYAQKEEIKQFISDAYVSGQDSQERKLNRHDALVEAYRSVPIGDMSKLQNLYWMDFKLFGYDPKLPILYNRNARNSKWKPFFFT